MNERRSEHIRMPRGHHGSRRAILTLATAATAAAVAAVAAAVLGVVRVLKRGLSSAYAHELEPVHLQPICRADGRTCAHIVCTSSSVRTLCAHCVHIEELASEQKAAGTKGGRQKQKADEEAAGGTPNLRRRPHSTARAAAPPATRPPAACCSIARLAAARAAMAPLP